MVTEDESNDDSEAMEARGSDNLSAPPSDAIFLRLRISDTEDRSELWPLQAQWSLKGLAVFSRYANCKRLRFSCELSSPVDIDRS